MKKIILFLAFAVILLQPINVNAQSDHPDYAALEALYNATNGDWWWDNTNWLTEEPVSTWYGINVNENNRVSEINLEGIGLFGSLPDEIGDFEMLKVLNVKWNNFQGNIPTTITNLTHLEELDFEYCGLSGGIPDLTSLSLTTLNIDGNNFQFGDFEDDFSYYFNNIQNFFYQNQRGENLYGNVVQLGDTVDMVVNVSGSNNIYSWYKLNDLYEEILIENENNTVLSIPDFQNEDSGIYRCKISSNTIIGLEIKWTFEYGLPEPPAGDSPDYATLETFYYATGGPTEWYEQGQWLNKDVPLSEWGGISANNQNRVTEIYIWFNNLTGSIPSEIGNLDELIYLNLQSNNLSDEIPTEISNLNKLQVLNLADNSFSGGIPKEIGNLINLETITLYDSNLSGSIPYEIGNLTNLLSLTLSENNLTGEIPKEIGDLTKVEHLWLDQNNLSGSIPPEISNMTSLVSLNLFSNNLSGEIPIEITEMIWLEELALFRNNLSGNIPPEIGNMENLKDLPISYNNFTGNIPKELNNLINLERIALRFNNLEGTIPNLENLTKLGYFTINNNSLEGVVPEFLSNLPEIYYLDISNNNFSGPLPDFSNTALNIFGISGNDFIFSDLENQFNYLNNNLSTFVYSPMNPFDEYEVINKVSPPKVDVTLSTLFENHPNASANNSYQWYKNYEPIDGATSPNYLIENAIENDTGEYTCMVTNSVVTGLTLERNPYSVSIIDKIPNPTDVVFKMYPNPTSSTFSIISDTVNEGIIQVYNFQGVLAFEAYYSSEYSNEFIVSHLHHGIHIVKLSTFDGQVYYNKLIKK